MELDLLSEVLNNGPLLIIVLDRHGCVMEFNRHCESLTGWRFSDVRGEPVWKRLIPPEQAEDFKAFFRRMLLGESSDYHEHEWLSRDGHRLLIAWSTSILRNGSDGVTHVIGMGRDITGEVDAREALAVKTRHEAAILRSVGQGVYGIDGDGRITFVNEAAARMLGYSREALCGQLAHSLLHHHRVDGTLYPETECPTFAAMSAGIVTRQEEVLWRQDGTMLTVWFVSSPLFENDTVVGAVIAFDDLTERKRLEARLVAEKERFRITLESIADAVLVTDRTGLITYLNPAAERLTGWSQEEALSRSHHEVLEIKRQVDHVGLDPVALCLESNTPVYLDDDLFVHKRDGVKARVRLSVSLLPGPQEMSHGTVLVVLDVTEKQQMAARIGWQARHDELTELVNRAEFERCLAQAADDASRNGTDHILLFIDLDQFKIVNDTSGHLAGDELLRQAAKLLRNRVRRSDIVSRLGGDEFGVLLSECPRDKAMELAEELRAALAGHSFIWEERSYAVSASIGLVSVKDEGGDIRTMMSLADMALYSAKEAGRNRLHACWEHREDLAARHGEMLSTSHILEALEENRFVLYGQRIVALEADASDQEQCEILIRMLARDGTLIQPGGFIPAAERYGLMPAIDRWVVGQVLDWIGRREVEEKPTTFFINLSGQSLTNPDFAHFLGQRFSAFPEAARWLCFEITETAAIKNFSHTTQIMQALHPLGCRFALDDFGSGQASFNYLRELPVDVLKIDGSFVKRMARDRIDYAMVRAINEIAQTLLLKTVGEFVEDEQTLDCLRELGISFAQGFALEKPIPIEEFLDMDLDEPDPIQVKSPIS